jgi:alpha-ketoglutarate-dependent taurine dioxygenase
MNPRVEKINPFGALVRAERPDQDARNVDIRFLRELFQRERLIVLRGFRIDDQASDFADYCALWGKISLWPFGAVLELVERENPEDHIFDSNYVPLHWDGMYRPQVPEYQIFQCVQAPGCDQGGRTTFSNTRIALDRASASECGLWEKAVGVYERKMEFYHSKTIAPVVGPHPSGGFLVIRYCEPPREGDAGFINHPSIVFDGLEPGEVAAFQRSLHAALHAPGNFYAHAWQEGDIVIADNHTLLHGREAFTSGASRHLRRVHVLGSEPLDNPHLVFHE